MTQTSYTVTFRSFPMPVANAAAAANARLSELREEAHSRASHLVPGAYWTAGLSVILVAITRQQIGTMTVDRADQTLAAAMSIWGALIAAENDIQAVLDDTALDEGEKVELIDAIWPTWPDVQGIV